LRSKKRREKDELALVVGGEEGERKKGGEVAQLIVHYFFPEKGGGCESRLNVLSRIERREFFHAEGKERKSGRYYLPNFRQREAEKGRDHSRRCIAAGER